ncbi:MAG: radical SAM protein [Bacillota bacterium]
MDFTPSYLQLPLSEMEQRAMAAQRRLAACTLCPWKCVVDRPQGERGHCRAPAGAVVSSFHAHFGEEPPLVGDAGSGTIFFSHCNLDCVFCQNWEISHLAEGEETSTLELARIMLVLQGRGCHNINLVTPSPHVAAILQALLPARKQGLKIPLVYNSGGYESVATLRLLEGIVDIYLPDFKYAEADAAQRCSGPRDYPVRARRALREMQRQVGDLVMDEQGIARRGLLVRHLVLPGGLAGTKEVVRFLAEEISPNCAVNIMGQYYPAYRAERYPPLDRRVNRKEVEEARAFAAAAGLLIVGS